MDNLEYMEDPEYVNEEFINIVLSEINKFNILEKHTFFNKIHTIDPKTLGYILTPFYYAVKYWTEHLKLFRDKLLNGNDIVSAALVQENIDDESGYVTGKIIYSKKHIVTYIYFLLQLNYNICLKSSPAIKKFSSSLKKSLDDMPLAYNAAILGGIEHFYIQISTAIKNYCDKNNIKQEHYNVHEILDQKHAMDFFKIAINQNITKRQLFDGMHEGYKLLWDLYEDLVQDGNSP